MLVPLAGPAPPGPAAAAAYHRGRKRPVRASLPTTRRAFPPAVRRKRGESVFDDAMTERGIHVAISVGIDQDAGCGARRKRRAARSSWGLKSFPTTAILPITATLDRDRPAFTFSWSHPYPSAKCCQSSQPATHQRSGRTQLVVFKKGPYLSHRIVCPVPSLPFRIDQPSALHQGRNFRPVVGRRLWEESVCHVARAANLAVISKSFACDESPILAASPRATPSTCREPDSISRPRSAYRCAHLGHGDLSC